MFVNSAKDLTVKKVVTIATVVVRGRLLVPLLYFIFLTRDIDIVLRIGCTRVNGGGKEG